MLKILTTLSALTLFTLQCAGFEAREVTVDNTRDGITLAGTLTTPGDGAAVRGTVVLATGSGTQDRDETILGHKPFKAIAESLSDAGYAVLRMDDRGAGSSQGDPSKAVTDDYVTDILAGLHYVKTLYPGVPSGIAGHSEGGVIAVKGAVRDRDVDFIISLGCPALPGDSVIMAQIRALSRAATDNDDAYNSKSAMQRRLLDVVKSPLPESVKRARMLMILSEGMPDETSIPQVRRMLDSQIDAMLTPWYVSFMRYDPAADIMAVAVPWLAINGDLDLQVTPDNLDIIARNPYATTMLMPGHNHLLQRATTGMPDEYAHISEPIDPEVIAAMITWLDNTIK